MFEWMVNFFAATGVVGIALLMFLENVFPPIPSELIMPMAGFAAARGEGSLAMLIAAGTVGSLAGALFWYGAGRRLGRNGIKRAAARHGRWITLCPPDVDRAIDRFERYGALAVIGGRLVPALRTIVSVPAGISRMPLGAFVLLSALGTAMWTAALAGAGYLLGDRYQLAATYLNPATNIILAALVAWYVWRVINFTRHQHKRGTSGSDT